MALHKLLAFVVYALAYIAIATGKLPRLSLDRAAAALAGAVAMTYTAYRSHQYFQRFLGHYVN